MPRQDLIKFKKDPTAQLVAQMVLWIKADRTSDEINSYFSTFKAELDRRTNEYYMNYMRYNKGVPTAEYELLSQAHKAANNFSRLINTYAIRNLSSDSEKLRDIIVDATKELKVLQGSMESLANHNIYINPVKIAHMGGTGFFQPDKIKIFFADNGRLNPGKELLNSYLFDENNPIAVQEFDKIDQLPRVNFDNMINRREEDKRSYEKNDPIPVKVPNAPRQNGDNFREEDVIQRAVQAEEVRRSNRYRVDPIGAVIDVPVEGENISKDKKDSMSKAIILGAMKSIVEDYKQNGPYSQKLKAFKTEIEGLRDNLRANPGALAHGQDLISFLTNELGEGLYDRVNFFISNIETVATKQAPTDEDYMKLYQKYNNLHDKDDDFKTIQSILSEAQDNPIIGAPLKQQFKLFAGENEKILAKQVKTLANADPFEKYVMSHSAPVVTVSSKDGAEHLAKLIAAHQWKQKVMSIPNPNNRPAFKPKTIDGKAADLMKNPVFKAMYTKKQGEEVVWDVSKIKDTIERNEAYKAINRLEEPFLFDIDPRKQRDALKTLQNLGNILPSSRKASSDYQRFNGYMKSLAELDVDNMRIDELGLTLGRVYRETERYMKGRKSERMTDTQQEHFNETLDVLAVLAKTGKNGKALADKLVNRTNEVRTNWFHKIFDEKTVSLEGRSNEATQRRIDILEGRIRPQAQNQHQAGGPHM